MLLGVRLGQRTPRKPSLAPKFALYGETILFRGRGRTTEDAKGPPEEMQDSGELR